VTRRRCLSIHARYACAHAGACCTAQWPIPAEQPLIDAVRRRMVPVTGTPFEIVSAANGSRLSIVATTEDGACVFFEPGAGRLCAIHRTAGPRLLPSACRNFPRIALRDPRGVFVTLSHYCPTAARLLLLEQDLAIVDAPPSITLDGEVEGLDATGVLPPLLRPGMLMSLDAYDTWEREAVATLNDRRLPPAEAVAAISAATAAASEWRPGDGDLSAAIEEAFADARAAVGNWRPVSRLEHAVKSFLAAHAFASWAPYQDGGLGAGAAAIQTALEQLDRALPAARPGADTGADDTFITAVRQTDLLLRHAHTDVGAGSLSPLRRD
jgi:Fe-S-cluster containining protein